MHIRKLYSEFHPFPAIYFKVVFFCASQLMPALTHIYKMIREGREVLSTMGRGSYDNKLLAVLCYNLILCLVIGKM